MHGVAKPKWNVVDHKWQEPYFPSVQQYIDLLEKRIEELENSRISFYFNKQAINREKLKELTEMM